MSQEIVFNGKGNGKAFLHRADEGVVFKPARDVKRARNYFFITRSFRSRKPK